MERINQELEQYLCLFINQRQDDWVRLLPFAEFQYNNHVHYATQQPPFLLDTRWVPYMGFKPGQQRSCLKSLNKFKECMEDALEEAKAAKSKDDLAKYYNQRCQLASISLSRYTMQPKGHKWEMLGGKPCQSLKGVVWGCQVMGTKSFRYM